MSPDEYKSRKHFAPCKQQHLRLHDARHINDPICHSTIRRLRGSPNRRPGSLLCTLPGIFWPVIFLCLRKDCRGILKQPPTCSLTRYHTAFRAGAKGPRLWGGDGDARAPRRCGGRRDHRPGAAAGPAAPENGGAAAPPGLCAPFVMAGPPFRHHPHPTTISHSQGGGSRSMARKFGTGV